MILRSFEVASTELSCYTNEFSNTLFEQLSQEKAQGEQRNKEWFKDRLNDYNRYSNIMRSVFANESDFYGVVSLLLQQFSMLHTNFHFLPRICLSLKEIMFEVNYFYKTINKLSV
mmetsp:Transcript_9488/g.9009  ORF Transcript_9488/g.9009 Transcript_9488/m.9009 type:complete len:115 (-) Transcript_9488:105-449(-)